MIKNTILNLLILILTWEVLAYFLNSLFFPSFFDIVRVGISKVSVEILCGEVWATVSRSLLAFLIANILSIIFGYLIWSSKLILDTTKFSIDFFRSIPAIVVFPVFMVFFGINDFSRILTVVFGIFWINLFSVIQILQNLPVATIRYLKSTKASKLDIFRYCICFVFFKNWISISRVSLSLALLIMITLEMIIGSNNGIGKVIIDAKNYFEIDLMYFWIMITGIIGYFLNTFILRLFTSFLL